MIEFSLGKLILLALIALIVLGPEKLPGAARTAGALLRRVRSGWDDVRAEVERELEVEEIRRAAREAVAKVDAAQQEVRDGLRQVHGSVGAVVDEVAATGKPAAVDVTEGAGPVEAVAPSPQADLPLGEPMPVQPMPAHAVPAEAVPAAPAPMRNAAHDDA